MHLKDVWLKVVGGDAKAAEIKLNLPTIIGRSKQATLTLPHPLVSRNHCELFERDGKLWVKDLASLNGSFVDNVRLEGESVLEPTQLLTIGTVTFRAIYGEHLNGNASHMMDGRDEATFAKRPSDSTTKLPGQEQMEVQFTEASDSTYTRATETGPTPGATPDIESTTYQPRSAEPESPRQNAQPASPKQPAKNKFMDQSLDRPKVTARQTTPDAEHVLSTSEMGRSNNTGNMSVVAALKDIEGIKSSQSVSLAALAGLVIEERPPQDLNVSASDIHVVDSDKGDRPQVGQSFLAALGDDAAGTDRTSPNDSSLDSFIRKLPR